jgi:3'-phosphoadenosine 5'-phosphosulfate sulfotransferase (PAPS reductase)/FAD synthetase
MTFDQHDIFISKNRVIAWFSCGATSAIAAKIALDKYGSACELVYTDPGSEHPDNQRFLKDCQQWLQTKIIILKSRKFKDVDDVIQQRQLLVGPKGAPCTQELKRNLALSYRVDTDLEILGFDSGEIDRAVEFRDHFPFRKTWFPLIEMGLTKGDCLAVVKAAGIKLPTMYELGYRNNNCIGCVKGGLGYWNKIRIDFPNVFKKRAAQERKFNAPMHYKKHKDKTIELIYLDQLKGTEGNYKSEPSIECGQMCEGLSKPREVCI